jgi:hypothetical protein
MIMSFAWRGKRYELVSQIYGGLKRFLRGCRREGGSWEVSFLSVRSEKGGREHCEKVVR